MADAAAPTPPPARGGPAPDVWDLRYEWRAIALLAVTFGLVGLDRFLINPLFPAMMRDLHLSYQDLGLVAAIVAVTWGVGSLAAGPFTDRVGARRMMTPAVLAFSLMAGLSGLAIGMASLMAARAVMGLAEGAFMPPSIGAAVDAARPRRRGFVFGLQQNGLPLIGLGLGPIVATQLLALTGSWRWTFSIVALPGLAAAYLIQRTIRDRPAPEAETAPASPRERWRTVLTSPNVLVATGVMVCMSGSLNVVIAMTPSYLVDHLAMTSQQMGFVASAIGLGAVVGGLGMPALSDKVGRKPVMLAAALGAALSLWGFMNSTPAAPLLFLLLMAVAACGFSVIYITVGPLTIESAPAAVASTAVGVVVGAGEIVGGAIAPTAAGYVATHFGIAHAFVVALVGLAICCLMVLALSEPRRGAAGEGRGLPA